MSYYMKLNKIEELDKEFLPDCILNYEQIKNVIREYKITIIALCLNPTSEILNPNKMNFYTLLNMKIQYYISCINNKVKYEIKQKWEEEKDGMEFSGSVFRNIYDIDINYIYELLIENLFIYATVYPTPDIYKDPEKYDSKYNNISESLEIEEEIYQSYVKKLAEKYGKSEEG